MCGIIAYVGTRYCKEIIINGLKRLEYRGYDSAGIAIISSDATQDKNNSGCRIISVKQAGKIKELQDLIKDSDFDSTIGIGHTRWATHGAPTQINAHPHLDCSGKIAVVHNGIIENYAELKDELIKKGHKFISETDTEVLPHLLEEYYEGDMLLSVQKLLKRIKGSGAIVVLNSDSPDEIIAARIASPLIIGIGKEGNFLASDMPAVLEYTRNFIIVNDFETIRLKKDSIEIFDTDGRAVQRE